MPIASWNCLYCFRWLVLWMIIGCFIDLWGCMEGISSVFEITYKLFLNAVNKLNFRRKWANFRFGSVRLYPIKTYINSFFSENWLIPLKKPAQILCYTIFIIQYKVHCGKKAFWFDWKLGYLISSLL